MFCLIPGPRPGGGGGSGGASGPGTVIIRGVTGNPAAGSTNNRVQRFNAEVYSNSGPDATFTDSATLGSYFTIVTPGLYFSQASVVGAANNGAVTIRRGDSVINTLDVGSTDLDEYPIGFIGIDTSWYPNLSGYIFCESGDVLHVLSTAALFSANTAYNAGFKFQLIGPF